MTTPRADQVFDTRRVPQTLRVSTWQSLSSRFLVPLNISAVAPTIEGQMRSYQRGAFKACGLVASPHTGHRTQDQASGAGAGHYKVAVATHGHVTVRQLDRITTLAPGELTIYDTSEAYSVGSDMPFGVFIALLPKDALEIHPELIMCQAVTKFSAHQTEHIRKQLFNLHEYSTADTWEKFSVQLGQLIQSHHRHTATCGATGSDLVARVQSSVAEYLDDPRLSPSFLAASLGVSRRQLYVVCTAQLGPLATYIRGQRLEHSRALLDSEADLSHPRSIADIALASGFGDPAHFSRLFRAHYSISPSDYRQLLNTVA